MDLFDGMTPGEIAKLMADVDSDTRPLTMALYLTTDDLEVDSYMGRPMDDVCYDDMELYAFLSCDLEAEKAVSAGLFGFEEMHHSVKGVYPPMHELNFIPMHILNTGDYLFPTTWEKGERRDMEFASAIGAMGLDWLNDIGDLL